MQSPVLWTVGLLMVNLECAAVLQVRQFSLFVHSLKMPTQKQA